MKITEAIILAGGEGTRLQSAVPNLPKCLAPINGRAFIDYLILHLQSQGIEKFIFALGVKAAIAQDYLNKHWPYLQKAYSLETSPAGTGGAIKKASTLATGENLLVTNGDTLFTASLANAEKLHHISGATVTIFLKPMVNPYRSGTVQLDEFLKVKAFHEKQKLEYGLINAGSYLLNLPVWQTQQWPGFFSFETDYLQTEAAKGTFRGYLEDAYFIDIGIPDDYEKAQQESVNW